MPKITKILTLIFAFLFLTSCVKETFSMPKSWGWEWWRARPYLARGLPDCDDDYCIGFRDGCISMLSIVAPGFVRNMDPRYDGWKLTSNAYYAAGFVDGEEHCTYLYDWDIV